MHSTCIVNHESQQTMWVRVSTHWYLHFPFACCKSLLCIPYLSFHVISIHKNPFTVHRAGLHTCVKFVCYTSTCHCFAGCGEWYICMPQFLPLSLWTSTRDYPVLSAPKTIRRTKAMIVKLLVHYWWWVQIYLTEGSPAVCQLQQRPQLHCTHWRHRAEFRRDPHGTQGKGRIHKERGLGAHLPLTRILGALRVRLPSTLLFVRTPPLCLHEIPLFCVQVLYAVFQHFEFHIISAAVPRQVGYPFSASLFIPLRSGLILITEQEMFHLNPPQPATHPTWHALSRSHYSPAFYLIPWHFWLIVANASRSVHLHSAAQPHLQLSSSQVSCPWPLILDLCQSAT